MARIKIVFNGRVLNEDEYSTDAVSVKKSIDPKNDITQEFVFYKQAYNEIKSSIIDTRLGQAKSIPIKIYDLCCGYEVLVFDGEIKGPSVEWCEKDCFAKAIAIQSNPFLDCLKGQIISEGLENIAHPNIPMLRDLSDFEKIIMAFLKVLLFSFVVLMMVGMTAILVFLTIVEVVIQAVDVIFDALRKVPLLKKVIPDIIPRDDRDILPDVSELPDIYRALFTIMKAVDSIDYHTAPYLRVIIQNACNQCGISDNREYAFRSSILNDPASEYYNLTYFKASKRGDPVPKPIGLIDANKPILTASDLLDQLNDVFNARWYITDETLYFESRHISPRPSVDVSSYNICYSFSSEDIPARAIIEYKDDAIDTTANTKQSVFDYVKNFNGPDFLRGKKKYEIPFGRFVITPFKGEFSESGNNMLKMPSRSCSLPKLLIFNGRLEDNGEMYGYTLWQRFFFKENPLDNSYKGRRFDFQGVLDCSLKPVPGQEVITNYGVGVVEEAEYDYSNRVITISGRI